MISIRSVNTIFYHQNQTRFPLYLFLVVPPQKRMPLQSGLKVQSVLFSTANRNLFCWLFAESPPTLSAFQRLKGFTNYSSYRNSRTTLSRFKTLTRLICKPLSKENKLKWVNSPNEPILHRLFHHFKYQQFHLLRSRQKKSTKKSKPYSRKITFNDDPFRRNNRIYFRNDAIQS